MAHSAPQITDHVLDAKNDPPTIDPTIKLSHAALQQTYWGISYKSGLPCRTIPNKPVSAGVQCAP